MDYMLVRNCLRKLPAAGSLSTGLILSLSAHAAVTDINLTHAGIVPASSSVSLYEDEQHGLRLDGGLSISAFGATTDNASFGSTSDAQPDSGPDWWEAVAIPELSGEVDLPGDNGTIFGGLAASLSMTRGSGHGDVTGSTPYHPESSRLKKSYLGWRSGELLADTLGKDALTFSFGRQTFLFGDGFLVGDAYSNTGKYGAYWIGPGSEFQSSAVLSLDSHGWHGDLFHLKAHQYVSHASDTDTSTNGVNLDYTLADRGKFGVAYLNIDDSDIDARDGMNVYNIRAKGTPFASIPGLAFGGQYVYEDNSHNGENISDDGWYLQTTYSFQNTSWNPEVAYRYAEFSKDYDPLFYSFAGGWGSWFFGEIVGEYMLFNNNLKINMVKASVHPTDSLTTGIIGYNFRFKDANAAGVSDKNFANEVDFYADWGITDHLSLSGVYAVAFAEDGAEQTYGDDKTSQLAELYATYTF